MVMQEVSPAQTGEFERGGSVTVIEAARRLGMHYTTLYRRIEAAKVVWFKFGGVIFIPVTEVERLKKERKMKEPAC